MKNKTLSIFGAFFKILNIFIMIFSVAGLTLFILNEFKTVIDFEPLKFIYLAIYELLLPFIYLFFGNIYTPTINNIVSVGVSTCVMLILLSFVAIKDISRATSYLSHPNKKTSYVWSGIYSFILTCLFGMTLVMTGVEYNKINTFISQNSSSLVPSSAIILKGIVLSFIAVAICVAMFIVLLASRSKGQKRVKEKVGKNIFFYSSQYEEKIQENKVASLINNDEDNASSENEKDTSPESKKLIERIMELNKMLANNEIDDIEYTRLRQIAIRRYKK